MSRNTKRFRRRLRALSRRPRWRLVVESLENRVVPSTVAADLRDVAAPAATSHVATLTAEVRPVAPVTFVASVVPFNLNAAASFTLPAFQAGEARLLSDVPRTQTFGLTGMMPTDPVVLAGEPANSGDVVPARGTDAEPPIVRPAELRLVPMPTSWLAPPLDAVEATWANTAEEEPLDVWVALPAREQFVVTPTEPTSAVAPVVITLVGGGAVLRRNEKKRETPGRYRPLGA